MRQTGQTLYLPTNLREFMSILENVRVAVEPGRSLEHLNPRPTVEPPLRTAEAEVITAGRDGDFPILLEVREARLPTANGIQTTSLPLSDVTRAVFRSDKERDIILNRRLDNVPTDLVRLDVDATLFGSEGESRYVADLISADGPGATWKAADQLGGALAGLMAAAEIHPDVGPQVTSFLDGGLEQLSLSDFLRSDAGTAGGSAVEVIRRHHDSAGQDGQLLLEELVAKLGSGDMPAEEIEAFRTRMGAILSSDEVRRPGSLSDEKNVLLRALSLLVQRASLEDVLADRIAGKLPGPRVFLMAAALAGMRDGLARLGSERKAPYADVLGQLTADVENGSVEIAKIRQLISVALAPAIAGKNPEAGTSYQGKYTIEVCPFSKSAVVKRALADISSLPSQWRLFLRGDDMLCLEISGASAKAQEEAKAKRLEWSKRSVKSRKSQAPKTRKASEEEGLLPGLMSGQADATD
jgi:hypothetical protein